MLKTAAAPPLVISGGGSFLDHLDIKMGQGMNEFQEEICMHVCMNVCVYVYTHIYIYPSFILERVRSTTVLQVTVRKSVFSV